ncbi:cell division protein SepF [Bacillus alkalicellulosilyticus]|uniref:cell division protein SepF n=1 Tax=Alkalihalobacterium alkalicellulosilyticum TaxID=1912214 RepID=UPI00099627AA|nr:cell division protein SepF [Bacillus alkalicellulosilyticus]
MELKSKFKRFFELEDEGTQQEYIDETAVTQEEIPERRRTKGQNVVALQTVKNTAKVILHEPRSYDEAQDIADQLKNRRTVIINLQSMATKEEARQVVDFLGGTVYAIEGNIQKLGANIFICTPDNVEVSGSITDLFEDSFE